MGNFPKYGGTSDGTLAPAPIVYNQIPVTEILSYPNKGWGFYSDMQIAKADSLGSYSQTCAGPWVVTATEAAATASSGILNLHLLGGGCEMQSIATEDKGIQIQQGEAFTPTAGYKIAGGCRIASDDIDQVDFFVGLTTTDTSICASRPDDAIGFSSADASAALQYNVSKTGGTSAATAMTTAVTLVDATYNDIAFVVTGTSKVEFYVDGVLNTTVTDDIPTVNMGFAIAMLSGEGATNNITLKNAYCYQWVE